MCLTAWKGEKDWVFWRNCITLGYIFDFSPLTIHYHFWSLIALIIIIIINAEGSRLQIEPATSHSTEATTILCLLLRRVYHQCHDSSMHVPSQDKKIQFVMCLYEHVIQMHFFFFSRSVWIKLMLLWYLKLHEYLGHMKIDIVQSRAVLHKHRRMSTHFMFPL